MSDNQYDVIIVGAGPGGIFCAYELKDKNPDLRVLLLEKGHSIEKRYCPKRKTRHCNNCHPCAITTGFAGAGAFSDGKLSLSPDVGGTLPDILGYARAKELIERSDRIYLEFGADTNVYGVGKEKEIQEIRAKAINANLKLVECARSAIWERKRDTRSIKSCSTISRKQALICASTAPSGIYWSEMTKK